MSEAAPASAGEASDNPRRAEIVAHAARLFARDGYHLASMRDISEAVGIRKATLYYYFTSKAEILYAIHDEFMDLVLDAHDERRRHEDGWEALLRGAIRDIVEITLERRGHIRVAVEYRRELSELPEELQTRLAGKRSRHYEIVKGLLAEGVDEGALDTDVTTTTFAVVGMAFWTYQWMRLSGDLGAEQLADRLFDLVVEGARPRT